MRIFYDHLIFNLQNFGGISRYVINLASNLNNINDAKIKIFAPIHLNYHLKKFDNKRRLFFPSNLNFQQQKLGEIRRHCSLMQKTKSKHTALSIFVDFFAL